MIIYGVICGVILALDQLMKYWILHNIDLGHTLPVIPKVFSLTYIQNPGAAWSILEDQMLFFTIVTLIAVPVCLYLLVKHRHESKFFTIGLTLVIAGALGNFIDRLRFGYVVDMFKTEFIDFPIFNIADMSLVIGVFCIFIYALFEERLKGKKK